jgi:probable non-F420 flavinoid oxidoreductase
VTRIGFHASHEQFPPEELLALVRRAQAAGFDAAMCSDHFHPWLGDQGHSGHAWSWLGSAMATTTLPFGVVTCPTGRHHPAVVAQAAATLVRMHGDRFWLAVGSGEALNEGITGRRWPRKAVRDERLAGAVEAMRRLWAGEEVTLERGGLRVEGARLYSRPETPPKLFAAALSEETARWAGGWADGLITVSTERATQRAVIAAFRDGGGGDKPVHLQVKLSYDRTDAAARAGAHAQWRANILGGDLSQDLRTPAQYAAASEHVRPEDLDRAVRVSADLGRHREWLRQDLEDGADALYLHNVNRAQAAFVDAFGEHVLPELR